MFTVVLSAGLDGLLRVENASRTTTSDCGIRIDNSKEWWIRTDKDEGRSNLWSMSCLNHAGVGKEKFESLLG